MNTWIELGTQNTINAVHVCVNAPTNQTILLDKATIAGRSAREIASCQYVDGALVPRPELNEPSRTGNTWEWVCPEGTTCEVFDLVGKEQMGVASDVAGVLSVELPDPGEYEMIVKPPLPHLPVSLIVEVTA